MKQHYSGISFLVLALLSGMILKSQCSAPVSGGSSSNLFTLIRNSTNPVAADKLLNTVVFIHRNNASSFGGNSGQLRYDVSYNGGTSFTTNVGVLNPLTTNLGRYPNVAIYNPTNNLTPSNAYLGYLAATINSATSAWNGVVSGVSQLNSTTSTETYNQPVVSPQLIAHSLVKGAPGVFWSVDALFNGANITGFTIYRGQWNSTSSDIVWANNFTVTPSFNTGLSTIPTLGDYNIAFDPSGTFGWFSFLGHLSPGPSNYALYPVFYKTTNGGVSWTGPFQVNLNNFSCLTANTSTSTVITTNFEHDLTVDVNGNPHLFTTICNGSNAYGVSYTQWHHMYDITQKNGLWVAYDVANVLAGRGNWGVSPNIVSQDMSPQVSRTADGSRVFFTWTDNSVYTLGQANLSPNLFGKAYNVNTDMWTQVKDFTSCNISTTGNIIVPHVAAEVLEPSTNVFKLAPVYGIMTSSDPILVSNFNFLDNVTFSTSEFTVNPPPSPTIAIAQGSNVLLCPGSTINISVAGSVGQAIWSNGATTTMISISSPTINTYSVVAQQNCNVGTATISVTNMSINPMGPLTPLCEGSQATLNVSGNALSYSWSPVNLTGTNVVVTTSTAIPVYTVFASSNANCVASGTVGVNVLSLPTVTISGSNTVCANALLTLTANGASTYTWSNGSNAGNISIPPTGSVMCIGTDLNGCENSDVIYISTYPVPTVSAISDKTVICSGGTVALSALGAITYSWSNGTPAANTQVTPTVSSVYTVTGYDSNMCSDDYTLGIVVNPLPTILVNSTRPVLCLGEKAIISVSGANNYQWSSGATSNSIQVSHTITTNYTITGIDANSCANTATFTQVVSFCTAMDESQQTSQYLEVYPNPNSGSFFIKGSENMELFVVNELGQKIAHAILTPANDFEFKVERLAPGIYFVTFIVNDKMITKKLVVN